jgi:putative FmdB family regulatory protein
MPIYQYECGDCQEITDAWRSVAERNDCPKCECGGETKKIISAYHAHGDLEPYFDDNLQTFIQSKQHRKQVMQEQGVFENIGQGWYTSARKTRK